MASTEAQREKWRVQARSQYQKYKDRMRKRTNAFYHAHKDWYKEWHRRRNADSIEFIRSLKSKPCFDCGGTFPPCAMDFDHRLGESKLTSVGNLGRANAPPEMILEEIAKCDLVCANCHRIRTEQRRENRKRIVAAK
jgi:hypothetical protein